MEGKQRPTSVTVVAIILIVLYSLSILSGLVIPVLAKRPVFQKALEAQHMTVRTATLLPIVGGVTVLAAAIAMLNGLNWGRLLYFATVPLLLVLQWVLGRFTPMQALPIVLYIVFVILLTRPKAAAYFAPGAADAKKTGK
jgi:fatty acid desaturase